MSARRFRYALEPVLTARGWRVDALRLELAQSNLRIDTQQRELDEAALIIEAALREWAALSAPSRALDPAMVLAHAHHADRLQRQLLAKRQALEELRASRDETLVRLAAAMREHEALQDHRQEQRTLFVAAQVSDECKAADDQWVSSQNRRRDVHQA